MPGTDAGPHRSPLRSGSCFATGAVHAGQTIAGSPAVRLQSIAVLVCAGVGDSLWNPLESFLMPEGQVVPVRWSEMAKIKGLRNVIEVASKKIARATEQASRRLAATAIESGLWSHSTATMLNNWTAKEFRHVTRQDEKVCEICGPRDGVIFSGASNGPPLHPRCRCIAIPAPAG